MKKIILILVIVTLLTGCVQTDENSLSSNLDSLMSNLDFNYNTRQNHSSAFYTYYLPSDMSETDANSNASVIEYGKSKVVLNLNIGSLISNKYFNSKTFIDEGFFKDATKFYDYSGQFVKDDESIMDFNLDIYKHDDIYLINLATVEISFYGSSTANELIDLIRHLFIIAKSANVDKESVIASYFEKDTIEYEKKQVNLFDYVIPSSGFISDLIKQSDGTVLNESNNENENINENVENSAENQEDAAVE